MESTTAMDPRSVIELLDRTPPRLHGSTADGPQNWRITSAVLSWMAQRTMPGDRTIETGCGYSTIVLAACGARHTVVSPTALEHERIRDWCARNGISTEAVEFVARPSEDYLPSMPADAFDLVLIDGCHAFPLPFLDWFFLAGKLKRGGRMIVDDTHLRTGWILRDFLAAESGRWALDVEFKRTTVFEKRVDELPPGAEWHTQPWGDKPRSSNKIRALRWMSKARRLFGARR